ncbi:MAG: hypothetical protein EOP49_52815, partial [Sphingobacteriales bacterium]
MSKKHGMKLLLLLIAAATSACQYARNRLSDQTFYETGELQSAMIRDKQGQMEKLLTYYKNGRVEKESGYENGQLTATTAFFNNGDTMCFWAYRNGLPDGRAYCYFENYKPAYEQFFKDGYKSGTWTYYEESGAIRSTEAYQERTSKAFDSHDFSLNTYYWQQKPAFTVSVQNGKHGDTVIINQAGYSALMPKVLPTGKQLFQANCASCHHPTRDAVGP